MSGTNGGEQTSGDEHGWVLTSTNEWTGRQVGQYKDNRGVDESICAGDFTNQTRALAAQFLDFWLQPAPSALPNHNLPSSNPMYPTQMWSPIPKNQPTCILLAKPEPRRLGFRIFGPNQSPCLTEWCLPATSNPMYPTPIGSNLPKNLPTCHLLAKTEPPPHGF